MHSRRSLAASAREEFRRDRRGRMGSGKAGRHTSLMKKVHGSNNVLEPLQVGSQSRCERQGGDDDETTKG